MSATMVASATKAIPLVVSSMQDILREKIYDSKTKLRRLFDEASLAELAAENIRQHGALQPIVVWPLPDGKGGTCALVAGACLIRASKLAKCEGSCEAPRCPSCRKIPSYFFLSRGSLVK